MGVGKTADARSIIFYLRAKGYKTKYVWFKSLHILVFGGDYLPLTWKRILDLAQMFLNLKIIREVGEVKQKLSLLCESPKYQIEGDLNVSIIVPTHNEAGFLPRLFWSIQQQTYTNIEVIVADYISTDETKTLAKRYGAKVLNIEESGISLASHIAAMHSQGDIIIRTDADAYFPPTLIERVVNVFKQRNQVKVICAGHAYYDGDIFLNMMAHLYDKYWRRVWAVSGFFLPIKRDAYFGVMGFDPHQSYGEDWKLGYRIYKIFGSPSFYKDLNIVVFVSSRLIQTTGLTRYLLGVGKWSTYTRNQRLNRIILQ